MFLSRPLLWLSTLCSLALPTAVLAQPSHARWVTLGTSGGPAVQVERSQIANALVVNGAVYLFDAGEGARRQMAKAGLAESRIKAIFLSHHHIDHNASLGPLLFMHWLGGGERLAVFGPEGTATLANGLALANAPTALASFPISGPARPPIADTFAATDIAPDLQNRQMVYEDANIRVFAIGVDHFQIPSSVPLDHRPDAVAYRIETRERTIVYSGDTGPSPRLTMLAQGADLLVSEVVDIPALQAFFAHSPLPVPVEQRNKMASGMARNHLTTQQIGLMAAGARVRRVLLTHFVPTPRNRRAMVRMQREIGAHFSGPVQFAQDLGQY